MQGKIILVTEDVIVAKMDDGTFVRHDRSEHLWAVGEDVQKIEGHSTLYMPATSGHVYLTADYVSKPGENTVSEQGYISKDGIPGILILRRLKKTKSTGY